MRDSFTQLTEIIDYLKKKPNKGITTYEAFENLNITKLTTRLSEARAKGYDFFVIKEENNNAKFNRYFLKKEPK